MITELLTKLLSVHDLPEPPPSEPMPLLWEWMRDAQASGKYDDPWAMTLASATRDGVPSARIVLCKSVSVPEGTLTFFTNFQSRKGAELSDNPHAAAVFHWPHAKRQARIEGEVVKVSARENDEYFASRPLISRIGACVSRQSRPIASRAQLVEAAMLLAKGAAMGKQVQRPEWWGGLRIVARRVELWSASEGRLHQRVLWERAAAGGAWSATLLSP